MSQTETPVNEKKDPWYVRLAMSTSLQLVLDIVVVAFFLLNMVQAMFTDSIDSLRIIGVFGWFSAALWFFAHKGEQRWTKLYRDMSHDLMHTLDEIFKLVKDHESKKPTTATEAKAKKK